MTKLIINAPDDEAQQLKDWHAKTYPVHRKPYGAWLLEILSRARQRHDRSQARTTAATR